MLRPTSLWCRAALRRDYWRRGRTSDHVYLLDAMSTKDGNTEMTVTITPGTDPGSTLVSPRWLRSQNALPDLRRRNRSATAPSAAPSLPAVEELGDAVALVPRPEFFLGHGYASLYHSSSSAIKYFGVLVAYSSWFSAGTWVSGFNDRTRIIRLAL